jgi:hypothetical protein
MSRMVTSLVAAAALMPVLVSAQSVTRQVFAEVTRPSGAAEVDLRVEDFEVTEGGEQREIVSAKMARRPARLVLVVDSTDGIRQPIGLVRTALTAFVNAVDPQIEMMLVTVAGTPQIRVRPTLERQEIVKSVANVFGTTGANTMHRVIDDLFHRFGQTTDRRPLFVVLTTEGFESTQNINPQQITHLTDHFVSRGGTLHAIRLIVPMAAQTFRDGNLTELPVSLMIGRNTGGAFTNISPNGLLEVMERLATVINDAYTNSPPVYQIEFAGAPVNGKQPPAPQIRVLREGLRLSVISTP